jgi:hypothetical protein
MTENERREYLKMNAEQREQYLLYLASDAYLFHCMSPGGPKPKTPKKPKPKAKE